MSSDTMPVLGRRRRPQSVSNHRRPLARRRPSGAEEREAACRGRRGGGPASPTNRGTESLSNSCSGSQWQCPWHPEHDDREQLEREDVDFAGEDEPPFEMIDGAENAFFSRVLPQAGHFGFFLSPDRTSTSLVALHAAHSKSKTGNPFARGERALL
jgi:hypothetical protein